MKNLRKENGITLVALIVTVIILLILAGVSLALVTGQEGIITKTSESVNEHTTRAAQEQLALELYGVIQDYYKEKYVTKTPEVVSMDYALEYLAKKGSVGGFTMDGTFTKGTDETKVFKATISGVNYKATIDSNCGITSFAVGS